MSHLTMHRYVYSIVIVLGITCSYSAHAQKIKYKDLFPLLKEKNYEEGGPKLIQFLSDPKNQEQANPNLQMALWLEHRLDGYDIISDSSSIYSAGDSAVYFFEKAKSLIDEKELKKRDEYYQSFFRRDLRTGEFGIKVSDVHLDIEKKVESIEQRISNIKQMHLSVGRVEENQKLAMDVYRAIVTEFAAFNEMLIAADEQVQSKLVEMKSFGQQAIEHAEKVQDFAKKLGSDKYNSDAVLKSIDQYGVDGMTANDVRSGVIEIWNYEEWASRSQSEIMGGVALFKTMISKYANEIREKKENVKRSQNAEIEGIPTELAEQFDKYDPESTAKKLLEMETLEARIIKQVDLQLNPALMDSTLIGSQLMIFEAALQDAKPMKILASSITTEDLELAKKKYPDYINSFFQEYVTASKYVTDMQIWSGRQEKWLADAVDFWTARNRWGIDPENESWRYPLFVQDAPEAGFMTLGVPVKSAEKIIAYGANLQDKKGFVASFGPDRNVQWKLDFELPGAEITRYESDSIPTINGSSSFYIYNASSEENNFVVVSYTPSGVLNWGTVVSIDRRPVDFKFDELTQELTILMYPEEQLPLGSDELGYVVIDRTGNAR